MRNQLSFAVLVAVVCACSMHAAPAQAQRVFVSATGSDGNPCTFASPCRSFQHAHDLTAAGGEIDVLDPAGYGAVTITKAIKRYSASADNWHRQYRHHLHERCEQLVRHLL